MDTWAESLRKELNQEQLDVVLEGDGPRLVLAGAGSGKTRTLIWRVIHLIHQGQDPSGILLVTFTNKAASEMKRRITEYASIGTEGIWCGTFHHIGLRFLRKFSVESGYSPGFGILDQEDSKILLKKCYEILPFKPSDQRFPQASVLQKIISLASNLEQSVEAVLDTRFPYLHHFSEDVILVANEYKKRKSESNQADFDDLLVRWKELMISNKYVAQHIQDKFKYCLVDEYQDTNPIQNTLMELVAGKHKNLLVVGDDSQSIYSFRGAEIKNILDFPKRHPDTVIHKLETNYRSTPEILALANSSIQNNSGGFKKVLKTVRKDNVVPVLIAVKDVSEQAKEVITHIADLLRAGIPSDEIAVLFRARFHAAEIELELAKRGIQYVLRGGVRFFEQAHVKDLAAYLKIVKTPLDSVAWTRVLTQFIGIGDGTASKWHEQYRAQILSGAQANILLSDGFPMKATKRQKEGISLFKQIVRPIVEMEDLTPSQAIEALLTKEFVQLMQMRYDNPTERLDDLRELVRFANAYQSIEDMLMDISLREGYRGETTDGAADKRIVLTTIHQAKGLEWQYVFLLNLAEGQFPSYQSRESAVQTEEERRLFYVAVTRAKDELFLMVPTSRYDREFGFVSVRPSPFVEEIHPAMYERRGILEEDSDFELAADIFEDFTDAEITIDE